MHVIEQTNLKDDMSLNAKRIAGRGLAMYQSYMPGADGTFASKQEQMEKLAGVSTSGSINVSDVTYGNLLKGDDDKSVAQQVLEGQDMSAEQRRDEVAVVANTMSTDDLKQMEESGFSITDTDSRTIITVTDKIKAVLAEAGVDVSSYGGKLTREELEEITGNPVIAEKIVKSLEGNDLPVTDENVEDCESALEQAASIEEVSDDAIAYLLKNALEPTIHNVYTAEHVSTAIAFGVPTGAAQGANASVDTAYTGKTADAQSTAGRTETAPLSGGPYADGAPRTMGGEFSDASEDIDFESMRGQITDIIEDAGLTANDAVMADSEWLISQHIPLTGDNIKYLEQLRDLSYSLKDGSYDWDELINSMSKAISGGRRPQDAYMITARRKLEETRLAMTTEASRSMLKQGIEIDTKPLQALVESLKAQERMYYGGMFGNRGIDANYGNLEAFSRATEVFEDLKKQPACVLAQAHMDNTVEEIYEAGRQLQAEFEEADERYETLQTAPRADMGDAIQKAFRNVDDILTDLDLDTTDANRRAVRILAYNQTALSEENIVKVKAMDEEMQRAFKNMTPAVTLGMIRKGINPLDLTVEELNDAAEQVRSEIGHDEQERFSKYLYKLEQNNEITEQERESYIGIYRLITQVERTDGAAIGSLMNQGSQLTMRNLLTAMRSTKKAGTMDYKVDDNFEGAESTAKGPRIDEQIEAGFQQNCIKDILDNISPAKIANLADTWEEMTPEQLAEALKNMDEAEEEQQAETEYAKTQLAEYREVLQSSSDVYAYLERYDISNSMANILAASTMLRKPNQMMDRLWREDGLSESSAELISQMKDKVMEELGESLQNPEELADAMEDLADVAEHVMDTMIVEDPSVRRLDVRELRQMAAQFQMCGQMAHEECYMLPVQTGNSVTGVTLKVVRGKEEKGLVDILFESHHMGKVAASFKASENGISGMIATDDEETRRLLAANIHDIGGRMQSDPENPEAVDLKVAHVPDLSLQHYAMSSIRQEEKMKNLGQLADDRDNKVQTTRLYSIAEGFIQTIKQLID